MTHDCRRISPRRAFSRLGPIVPSLSFALGLVAALTLASCGGGEDAELLSGGTAREITANLDTVERLADEGECEGAEEAAEQVRAQVEAVQGVEPELKGALERGADRLNEVVVTCEEPIEEETTTTTAEPEPEEDEEEDDKEREKKQKQREKEEEKAAKEAEKEAEKEGDEEESESGPPDEAPPPHSEGEGKGRDEATPEEDPSGGIGPGAAVEAED